MKEKDLRLVNALINQKTFRQNQEGLDESRRIWMELGPVNLGQKLVIFSCFAIGTVKILTHDLKIHQANKHWMIFACSANKDGTSLK